MVPEVTRGFYDRLRASTLIKSELATFDGQPAIFVDRPPPGTPSFPFILTAGSVSDTPTDTKTTSLRDITRDILIVDEERAGSARVERIAEYVRELFHARPFYVPGAGMILSEVVSGPLQADGPGTHGRVVSVRILIEES